VLVWPEKGEYIFTIDGYDVKTYNVGPLGNITFDSNIISRRGSREISWIWNF
jgi:hypothetical protein